MSQSDDSSSQYIASNSFYSTFDGHLPAYLHKLISSTESPIIYLAGDSTLDNKYWLPPETASPPGEPYSTLLRPPKCRRDVAYWLNTVYPEFTTVNCAIEATTLRSRRKRLLAQDKVIQERISSRDVLVVSVGGNDIGLAPTPMLILSILLALISNGRFGMGRLQTLFGEQIQRYATKLVERNKPRLILICMLYFPHMDRRVPSWASWSLMCLGYNVWPRRLQHVIKEVYKQGTCKVQIEGCQVVPVALFDALDASDSNLYVQRVEPSEEGGRHIAQHLKSVIQRSL